MTLDDLDLWPPPDPSVMEREPRKCRRHQWGRAYREERIPVVNGTATLPDGSTV